MPLNIKNSDVERLATEVASLARESKTEAIRKALSERKARLQAHGNKPSARKGLLAYLEQNVWPFVPPSELGRIMTREEEDNTLGFGPDGF